MSVGEIGGSDEGSMSGDNLLLSDSIKNGLEHVTSVMMSRSEYDEYDLLDIFIHHKI